MAKAKGGGGQKKIYGKKRFQKKKGSRKKKTDKFFNKEWKVLKTPKYIGNVNQKFRVGFSVTKKDKQSASFRNMKLWVNCGDLKDKDDPQFDVNNYKKMRFRFMELSGNLLFTQFNGFAITRDAEQSLIRKRSKLIETIFNTSTRDGYKLKCRVIGFTDRSHNQIKKTSYCKTTTRKKIMNIMRGVTSTMIRSEPTLDKIVMMLNTPDISYAILEATKDLYPLRDVEVAKIKVISEPKQDTAFLLTQHDIYGFSDIEDEESDAIGAEESDDDDESSEDEDETTLGVDASTTNMPDGDEKMDV